MQRIQLSVMMKQNNLAIEPGEYILLMYPTKQL